MMKTAVIERDWWGLIGLFAVAGAALVLWGCGTNFAVQTASDNPAPASPAKIASQPAPPPPPRPTAYGEIALPAEELAIDIGRWLNVTLESKRVAVTTFVNNNDLNQTSAFGRALTDALAAFIHRQGFEVIELKKTANFLIQPKTGEFYLSREAANLAAEHEVAAVVVGTYTEAVNMILVTARLISAVDGQILSSSVLELPKSANLIYLLGGGSGAGLARIKTPRRAPVIPPAAVEVFERQPKGSSKTTR